MRRITLGIAAICMLAGVCFLPDISAGAPPASKERVIYSFKSVSDGAGPLSDLTIDQAGNLYGTTNGGGSFNFGTVFELVRTSEGWKKQTLYDFAGGDDGYYPLAGVIVDTAGNLYGTTAGGGPGHGGTVFKLSATPGLLWKKTILYSFIAGSDSSDPNSDLVLDAAGNLFGTTPGTGLGACSDGARCGTVFELMPQADGSWKQNTIHVFKGPPDGAIPASRVLLDSAGNIFGSTEYGGLGSCGLFLGAIPGCGSIYELTPHPDGSWVETVVYSFIRGGGHSRFPAGGLFFDKAGHLFGTSGGGDGWGTVFELHDWPKKGWIESNLHLFSGGVDGISPLGQLAVDKRGNIFGVVEVGNRSPLGGIFEMRPVENGWHEHIIHVFGQGNDGSYPLAGLVVDAEGNLYGTTSRGGSGTCNCGTVYEVTPQP